MFLSVFISCKHELPNVTPVNTDTDTMVMMTPYEIVPPAHFPYMTIPADNQPTVERIRLGRMLYYDPNLSNDGRFCGGCHQQQNGFQSDQPVSGITVLPHENLAWTTNFMWDGSVQGSVEDVMLFEVKDFFKTDLNKMNNNQTYKSLFKKYFGVSHISYTEIAYALAQFERTIISRNSKYDRYLLGQVALTPDEEQGRQIFFTEKGDCFHCHSNPMLSDNSFHNTGLDSIYTKDADKGLYNFTGNPNDLGKFRTANLRNVALRTKYMHDGRFSTLDEVVEFYNSGMKKVNNLDPIMTLPGKENGLKLNSQEKYQLIQFLKTFTDNTFIADTTLSNPF